MMQWYKVILVVCFAGSTLLGSAQDSTTYKENPEDVSNIGQIVDALYDVISGPAGPRNWDRFQSLFLPNAQLNAINYDKQGLPKPRFGTVNTYIKNAGTFFNEHDFYEEEITKKVEYYANIAHVFSSYYMVTNIDGRDRLFEERGINAIQLIYTQDRWWIVNLMWNAESVNMPIPEYYLEPIQKNWGDSSIVDGALDEFTGENQAEETISKRTRVFKLDELDEKPLYPGGEIGFLNYLTKTAKIPTSLANEDINKEVKFKFVLNEQGKAENISILNSAHPNLAAAVIQALEQMPQWQPGTILNNPVKVTYPSIILVLE